MSWWLTWIVTVAAAMPAAGLALYVSLCGWQTPSRRAMLVLGALRLLTGLSFGLIGVFTLVAAALVAGFFHEAPLVFALPLLIVSVIELGGGILLLLGLRTRFVAFALFAYLVAVAAYTGLLLLEAHAYRVTVILVRDIAAMGALLILLSRGGGALSVDGSRANLALKDAIRKISELRQNAVSESSIFAASELVADVWRRLAPDVDTSAVPSWIAPLPDGGVLLEWRKRPLAHFSIWPRARREELIQVEIGSEGRMRYLLAGGTLEENDMAREHLLEAISRVVSS